MRSLPIFAAWGLGAGLIVGALFVSADKLVDRTRRIEPATWTEIQWPFPTDQFGRGKAFRCSEGDCGTTVTVYLRAKIGFCNCTTGVADDEELERIGDLDLLGGKAAAHGDGRPIAVAHMKGRSRSYALIGDHHPSRSALSIGYNDRCDAVVATVVVEHDRARELEGSALALLKGPTVMRWTEMTLGL